jgi:hypothetical protein
MFSMRELMARGAQLASAPDLHLVKNRLQPDDGE